MAVVQVRKSDISGEVIPDGSGARVRVIFADDRTDLRADLTEEEVAQLLPFAIEVHERPTRRTSAAGGD